MKQAFTLFMLVTLTTASFAQNQIVVQSATGSPTFYNDLNLAVAGAIAGDRIYIPGGSYNLSSILYIDKRLEIIGAGYNSDSSAATGITKISGSDIYFRDGSSNSLFTGIYFGNDIRFNEVATQFVILSNIRIIRCNLNAVYFSDLNTGSSASNIFISECILRGSLTGDLEATIFSFMLDKCIVAGQIINFVNTCLFSNNALMYNGSYTFSNVDNCLIQNNIVYSGSFSSSSVANTMSNNITVVYNGNTSWTAFGIATGNIQIANSADVFVSVGSSTYSEDYDYHLKPGSPGQNAGTDGKDIGIYGTISPWKEGGIPFNPHIRFLDIDQYTNPATDKFNVEVTVSGQGN